MSSANPEYSWNAKDYAKHSTNQYEWAKELIPKLELSGSETLLDIGCGDGKVTATLAKYLQNGKAVGIDSSQEMITLARRSFPSGSYPNLSFTKMDARKLTFKEQFDVAFSNAALHWIVNHKPVLLGVRNSLKSSGRLLFQMAGKGNAKDVIAVFEAMQREEKWKPNFAEFSFPYGFYSPEEYKQWLREAGLKPERVELVPKDMKLQGKEGLAGWIRTTWLPFTERVPSHLRAAFVAEIADRYLAAHPSDEVGVVHIEMTRLEIQATKA